MSIYGVILFLLSAACGALSFGTNLPTGWDKVVEYGTALFGTMFIASLIIGRRIKFDPVLR